MVMQHNRLLALNGFGLLLLLGLFLGRQWVAHAQTDPPVHPDGWDRLFAGDGRLETGCTSYNSNLQASTAVYVQPDDKFIVAANCNEQWSLLRYLPNGTPDLSFGKSGRITTDYGGNGLLTIQTDGKVVAAFGLRLTRFHTNGAIDTSFGINGVADVFGTSDENNQFLHIALQQDDKIVVGGVRNRQPLLARYTSDGNLDTTFSGQGFHLLEINDDEQADYGTNHWGDLAIQPDGKIVVGRTAKRLVDPFYQTYDYDALLARYDGNGSLDSSFGNGGLLNYGPTSDDFYFSALGIQPDSKILVSINLVLIRLFPSGAIDEAFSPANNATGERVEGIALDQVGRILLYEEMSGYAGMDRLLPDGSKDLSFIDDEEVSWLGLPFGYLYAPAKPQSDGRLLFPIKSNEGEIGLTRYDGNRPMPTSTATQPLPTHVPTLTPTPTPTPTPLPPEQRALALIYAVLDNNLGSEWTRLVNNIEAGAHPGVDVRLLIDGPATGDAYVYQIQPDRNPYCPTIENPTCDGRYREGFNYQRFFTEDTARPHALYQFLVDGFNAYPQAPQISLTIIGHGSGWGANALPAQPSIWRDQNDTLGGMLWDDHTGVQAGSRSLSTLALGQAIHWATSETKRALNLLYLDGCSMGMTEVAYELGNRADYLLASPNTDWATFAYDQLLPLVRYERDGRALGEAWLAAEAALMRSRTGYPFTLALTDLRQITPLATTVTAFADALQGVIPTQRAALTLAYQQSDRFDSNYDAKLDSDDNYLDLRDFAAQVQSSGITDTLVISHAQAVQTLLSSVVITVAQQNGSPWLAEEQRWVWRNLGGLSIYAPLHQDEAKRRIYYTKENLAWAADSSWDEFLTTFWDSDGAGNTTAAILTSELPVCFATTQNCVGLANQLPVQPPQSIFLPIASKFGDQP